MTVDASPEPTASQLHAQSKKRCSNDAGIMASQLGMGLDRNRGRGNTLQEIANSRTAKAAATAKPKKKKKKASIAATWILTLLGLFVVGTFIVLSTVRHYFGTHTEDFITLEEIQPFRGQEASLPYEPNLPLDQVADEVSKGLHREKIPRIIHQTWKTEVLPERWLAVREACIKLLPDYEFKLWSDATARDFIKANYTSFLSTWDSYTYNIQRADAIRYFVLHHFGGIYMDLDIGCRAHPGPLMHFETILPATKPVGVSNDLIFSAPRTPFMDLVINSLETFNHDWLWMNYPTVMFSTGPMFISAMYSMWCRRLASGVGINDAHLNSRVRILPKSLYGKNAAPEAVPDSFFWHYYGSSWHAGDAGFIGFLGKYGYKLLLLGSSLVIIGFCYLVWAKRGYSLLSPRSNSQLLEPFEVHSQTVAQENSGASAAASRILESFKSFVTVSSPYDPLPSNPPSQMISDARIRPPSLDSDSLSLHSIHKYPTSAQPQRHPLTSKPQGRQRSKDVERGSPIRSRSGSNQAKDANGSAGWYWSHPPSDATPVASTSAVAPTFSRHVLSADARPQDETSAQPNEASIPQRSSQYRIPRQSPLATSSHMTTPFFSTTREYRTSPSSSDISAPRYPRRPPIATQTSESDTDLSASELMDLLTELEPVVNASARSAQVTGEESSRLVRKRSFSNDGSPRIPDSR